MSAIAPSLAAKTSGHKITPEEWVALSAMERDAQIFARLRGDIGLDLCFLVNQAGHFVNVSLQVEDTLGFTQDEIARIPFFDLVHPDDIRKTQAEWERFRNDKRSTAIGFRNRYRTKSGAYVNMVWGNSWRSALGDLTLVTARVE